MDGHLSVVKITRNNATLTLILTFEPRPDGTGPEVVARPWGLITVDAVAVEGVNRYEVTVDKQPGIRVEVLNPAPA